jgi:hypothetical protein
MVAYGFVCFISPEISHLFAPALSAHVAIETYVMIQTNLSTNDSLLRNLVGKVGSVIGVLPCNKNGRKFI